MLPHSKDYSAEVSFMQPEQKKNLRTRDWPSVALVHAKLQIVLDQVENHFIHATDKACISFSFCWE